MKTKTAHPTLFLGVAEEVAQSDIPAFADRAVGPLYEAITTAGLEIAGDLHFMCPAFQGPGVPSTIQIGVPVKEEKPVPAPWVFWRSPAFTCAWTDHQGAVFTLPSGWQDFVKSVESAGGKLGTGWREIYKYWEAPDSGANVTELQREILNAPAE